MVSHHLEPELAWVPRLGCHGAEGADDEVPVTAAPLELYCLIPKTWVQYLQVQGSQAKLNMPGTPKEW